MHNTGNPLGSTQVLDLYDNSETIDQFVNSQQDEVPDRFGTKRLTLAGLIKRSMALRNEINDFSGALTFKPEWSDVPMNVSEGVGGEGGALNLQAEALGNRTEINKITSREALRRTYLEAGYNLVEGSFEAGGTLNAPNDVLLQESSGKVYSWSGTFPKIVFIDNPSGDSWRDMSGLVSRVYINVENYGAVADFDIDNPTIIKTNSTKAFYDATQVALATIGGVVYVPAGPNYFYIDDSIPISNKWEFSQPDSVASPVIIGESFTSSKIAFDAKGDPDKTLFFGRFPSGWPSSHCIENITLKAINGGTGIHTEGVCFAHLHRVVFMSFDTGLFISNGTAGRFSELSSIDMCWFRDNKTSIKLRPEQGDPSYNGLNLAKNLIEVNPGCVGIDIGAGCFVYNSTWQGSFAGNGTWILNNGTRALASDDFHFEGDGTVVNNGQYYVNGFWNHFNAKGGRMRDLSTNPITVGLSYTSPISYKSAALAGWPCIPRDSICRPANNSSGGFFPVRSNGIDSAAYVAYRGFSDWTNGLMIGSVDDSDKNLSAMQLHYSMSIPGIRSYDPSGFKFTHDTTPDSVQFSVNSSGRGSAKLGVEEAINIKASETPQKVVATSFGKTSLDTARILTIRVSSVIGGLIDIRRVYLISAPGYESFFTAVPLGEVMNIDDNNQSVMFDNASVRVSQSGVELSITTKRDVKVTLTMVGIGLT